MAMKKALLIILALGISFSLCSQTSSIAESNNDFSFSIFQSINKQDTSTSGTNLFVSPFSIYDALAMAYDGAASKTAKEMRNVMKFKKNQAESHKDFASLLAGYKNDKSLFSITNAAVAQKDYNFLDSYLANLKDFDATISLADFSNEQARTEALKNINEWVNKNTNGKIRDLLSKNDINSLTKLVLLNAIYFNAKWAKEFKNDKTRKMTFYGKNSVEYITDFMSGTQFISIADDKEASMIKMDYENEKASMFIIMPKENVDIDKFISNFTKEKFDSYCSDSKKIKADVTMPKFKIESRFEMKEILMGMGIKTAFTKNADFSKMNGRSNLLIDQVIHKSFIEVTESGTEAAAATAVIVREKTAVAKQNEKITINRPFIFVIKENTNNAILFVGKYVKPDKLSK